MKERQPVKRIDASPLKRFEVAARKKMFEVRAKIMIRKIAPTLEVNKYVPGDEVYWLTDQVSSIIDLLNHEYVDGRENIGLIEHKPVLPEIASIFSQVMGIDLNSPVCTRHEVGRMNGSIDTEYFPTPIDGITMSHRIVTNGDGTINNFGTYYEIERRSPGSFEQFVEYINNFENQT